jgi:hypothetical protein
VFGQAQAFPARLFLSSLRGRWLPNWVAPLGSGIEHLSNEVVLYRRSRPLKFTPERIQQIKNLVERGTGRDEIAALIGVTVGSLAVTCSRLGISLRRPKLNNGVSLLRRRSVSTLLKCESNLMKPDEAKFALILQYKGREFATELFLSPDMIGLLALDAEFRGMSISTFISELITSTVKNDLFRQVLDTEITSGTPAGQPTT